ncbi:MAG: DUF881 domain-containing protein [Clostridia bacterium]|nr:DUF881 domain-containing protein [Clostridia bacterium]
MKHADSPNPNGQAKGNTLQNRLLVAALLLLLGLFASRLTLEIRQSNRERAEARTDYDYYAEMLAQEQLRADNLESRIEDLTARLYGSYDSILEKSGNEELQRSWDTARALAGLTAVTGQGIRITLHDASVIDTANSTTIIHDSDVQYVVDTLRAFGAKAVAVNDERIVGTSKLTCNGPTILINRKYCPVPYVITAVGDAGTMAAYLKGDSYLLGRMADGVRIEIDVLESVTVPAYRDTQFIEQQIDLLEVVDS